jgi:hypothetical protein
VQSTIGGAVFDWLPTHEPFETMSPLQRQTVSSACADPHKAVTIRAMDVSFILAYSTTPRRGSITQNKGSASAFVIIVMPAFTQASSSA